MFFMVMCLWISFQAILSRSIVKIILQRLPNLSRVIKSLFFLELMLGECINFELVSFCF